VDDWFLQEVVCDEELGRFKYHSETDLVCQFVISSKAPCLLSICILKLLSARMMKMFDF